MAAVHERQPDEPALWFGRYIVYRELGAKRSVDRAFRAVKDAERLKAVRPGAAWYDAAQRWEWQQRAKAWDEAEREKFLAATSALRVDAQRRRLEIVGQLLEWSYAGLKAAQIDAETLSETQAREMLGALRMLFFDAIKAQRLEFGESTEIVTEEHQPFTADEMAAAMAEVEQWRAARMSASSSAKSGSNVD